MIKKKKILLVSNGFYPEISPRSYRATELAKEFSRQGHKVTVISKYRDYDYSDFLNEFPVKFKMWNKPILHSIPDLSNKFFHILGKGISRILTLLFEYPGIEEMVSVKKILKYETGYDLMISFAVPYTIHWGVAWSRTEKHSIAGIWIADCGDPYMGDVIDSFRKPFYFGFLEKWFCRKADFISIPVEGARSGYYTEFHSKIRVIPQGFDFKLNGDDKNIVLPSNCIPTFAYAGSFIPGVRDPKPLFQFLSGLDHPFKFLVFTNDLRLVSEYKTILNEKLVLSNYIPRDELITVLAGMDFLINFDNNTKLNSPSKLIDYAIAKRPVLNITRDFKREDLLAFINGDYRKQLHIPDALGFHIKNVSNLFLKLSGM